MAHGRPRISADPPMRVTMSDDEQAHRVDTLLAGYRLTLQDDQRTLFDRLTEADAARVINGKRLTQSATDIFVGWSSFQGRDYYVRQFRDMKIIPTTELIAPVLLEFATACGEALARARSYRRPAGH